MAFVITLDPHLDRAVAVIAAQKGLSKNAVIAQAVQEYLWNNLVVGDNDDVPSSDN